MDDEVISGVIQSSVILTPSRLAPLLILLFLHIYIYIRLPSGAAILSESWIRLPYMAQRGRLHCISVR